MASLQGLLLFLLSPLTFLLSETTFGDGLKKNSRCFRMFSDMEFGAIRLGLDCLILLACGCDCSEDDAMCAPLSCHGEGIELPSALLALSDTAKLGRKQ